MAASPCRMRACASSLAPLFLLLTLTLALALLRPSSAFLLPPFAPHARGGRTTQLSMAYDVRFSPNRWGNEPIEPGFGGIWPGDPDAKTHQVTVLGPDGKEVASMPVPVDRYIYFAFEDAGTDLPLVNGKRMCRNGCCTTCAAKVVEGKVKMEAALGLGKQMKKDGYTLTCCSLPRSDLTVQLQTEDEVYIKQWGETFEAGGVEWGGFIPEED